MAGPYPQEKDTGGKKQVVERNCAFQRMASPAADTKGSCVSSQKNARTEALGSKTSFVVSSDTALAGQTPPTGADSTSSRGAATRTGGCPRTTHDDDQDENKDIVDAIESGSIRRSASRESDYSDRDASDIVPGAFSAVSYTSPPSPTAIGVHEEIMIASTDAENGNRPHDSYHLAEARITRENRLMDVQVRGLMEVSVTTSQDFSMRVAPEERQSLLAALLEGRTVFCFLYLFILVIAWLFLLPNFFAITSGSNTNVAINAPQRTRLY